MRSFTVGAGGYVAGMSSVGKSWSRAKVACPSPGHAGSRVRFAGRHGQPGHRRQRYMCVPVNGEPAHRFTELLPREESWTDACETCEREVGLHEGPHAARSYQFVARGIAESLRAVGAGSTYRDAALVARERAKRLRCDPVTGEPRFSRHGSLVMDWVEVFAPVVFEPYRPLEWPTSGSLLLDDLPFRVRDPDSGRSRVAFRIFAAMGYSAGRPKLWRLEAHTSKSQADWEAFLGALPGAPPRVVCDNDHGLVNAVRSPLQGNELLVRQTYDEFLAHLVATHGKHLRLDSGYPAKRRLVSPDRSDEENRRCCFGLFGREPGAGDLDGKSHAVRPPAGRHVQVSKCEMNLPERVKAQRGGKGHQ
jgi:hypothetical protein